MICETNSGMLLIDLFSDNDRSMIIMYLRSCRKGCLHLIQLKLLVYIIGNFETASKPLAGLCYLAGRQEVLEVN